MAGTYTFEKNDNGILRWSNHHLNSEVVRRQSGDND